MELNLGSIVKGKSVEALVNDNIKAGYYSVPLDELAAGVYFLNMEAKGFKKTMNVLLTK